MKSCFGKVVKNSGLTHKITSSFQFWQKELKWVDGVEPFPQILCSFQPYSKKKNYALLPPMIEIK